MQLTYGQYIIGKNREQAIRTSSSDDDTNYEKINWYNDTEMLCYSKKRTELIMSTISVDHFGCKKRYLSERVFSLPFRNYRNGTREVYEGFNSYEGTNVGN
ncbi:hypothetical protein [Bacillus cereus group sp. Bce001]|uniref:hypothetical protein n=1 Tax=Bacillus cereus group sp. Bce001 TaxID=3445260 RepID=UPI003F257A3B